MSAILFTPHTVSNNIMANKPLSQSVLTYYNSILMKTKHFLPITFFAICQVQPHLFEPQCVKWNTMRAHNLNVYWIVTLIFSHDLKVNYGIPNKFVLAICDSRVQWLAHVPLVNLVNSGSGKGLLSSLPEPMLTLPKVKSCSIHPREI